MGEPGGDIWRPLVPPGRVVGLDVARCIALVGMIATHMLVATDADGGVTVVQQVAGGRASALFAVLAGVTLSLMSGRTEPEPVRGPAARPVAVSLAVRAVLIALLGLLLGSLPSGILVILAYYGVLFLLGIPFMRLRARALLLVAAAWVVVVPVLMHLVRMHLPEAPIESPTFDSLADPLQLLTQLTITGSYPALPWLAYLLVGMAVGRLDLTRADTARDLGVLGACLALVSWSASGLLLSRAGVEERLGETLTGPYVGNLPSALDHGLYGTTPTGSWWWLAVDTPHTGTPFDLAQTIGSALVVISLSLLLGRWLPRTMAVVAGAGAMTLTLYSLHLVLRSPDLLSEPGTSSFLAHVAIVMGAGAVYRLAGQSGPFERSVTWVASKAAQSVR